MVTATEKITAEAIIAEAAAKEGRTRSLRGLRGSFEKPLGELREEARLAGRRRYLPGRGAEAFRARELGGAAEKLVRERKAGEAEIEAGLRTSLGKIEAWETGEITRLKAENVQLDTGEWVDREEFEEMPPEQQVKLKSLGLEGYGEWTEGEERRFKRENVQLGTGEWVDKEQYEAMSEVRKTRLYNMGVAKYKEWWKNNMIEIAPGRWALKTIWEEMAPAMKAETFGEYYEVPTPAGLVVFAPKEWEGKSDIAKLRVILGREPTDVEISHYRGEEAPPKPEPVSPLSPLKPLYQPSFGKQWYDIGMEMFTLGKYEPVHEAGLEYDYEMEKREAAEEGMILTHPDTGVELTKREYVKLRTAGQPSMWEVGREWVPGSQFFIPGRAKALIGEGPLGWAKMVGYTALDVAMLAPVVGWGAKGASILLKSGSVGSKVAAMGGKAAVKAAAEAAVKNVATIEVEVATKQAAVRAAEKGLAGAIRTGAPVAEVAGWQKLLGVVQKELTEATLQHGPRVAASKVEATTLQNLLRMAEREAMPTVVGEKLYGGAMQVMGTSAKISPAAFKTFGVITAGTTAVEWSKLTPIERVVNIGMTALAFGVPGKLVGGLKSQFELWRSRGRIPRRTIEVPGTYLTGGMGMPKTSVKGLTTREQMQAMDTSAEAMERLWGGAGRVEMQWGRGLKYAPRSEFQRVVPKTMISATPAGTAFERGIYEVATIREPAQYFSAWGFPAFTEASAAGVKGVVKAPTYLTLFSKEVRKFPKGIGEAPTPSVLRSRAEAWYRTGAEPGTYPGYKLYRGFKEPEFTVPAGTLIAEAKGGIPLWTRERPFGPRIEIKPYFVVGEGERTLGYTLGEALRFKGMGPRVEWQAFREALSLRRGIAGESTILPSIRGGLRDLERAGESLVKELERLKVEKAPKAKIGKVEARLKIVKEDIHTGRTRLQIYTARAERAATRALGEETVRGALMEAARMGERVTSGARALTPDILRRETPTRVEDRGLDPFRQRTLEELRQEAPRVERMEPSRRPPFESRLLRPERIERAPDGRSPIERVSRPERPPREGRVRVPRSPWDRLPREGRPPREEPPRAPRVPPFLLPPTKGKKRKKEEYPVGTITWRQGFIRKYVPPPYEDVKPISVYEPKGSGVPSKTVMIVGGPAPITANVDLGVVDIRVEGEREEISFMSGGLKTDVGKRHPSKTRGMSVKARPATFKRIMV